MILRIGCYSREGGNMGRRASAQLDSKTARLKLKPRKQSYFTQVADRLTLGYNRREQGAGKWTRRELVDASKGRYSEREFGTADDYATADGVELFSFVQARGYVAGDGPKPKPVSREALTVNRAADDYLADLAARASPANVRTARYSIDAHIRPVLGAVRVARLTKEQIEQWRAGLLRQDTEDDADRRRRSANSANRVTNVFKAMMNHAFASETNNLPSDAAWRRVKRIPKAEGSRDVHFETSQSRTLIAKAATFNRPFAHLIEGGFYSGCRYGELTGLQVRDFDAAKALLFVRKGKTGMRRVVLTSEAVAFFARLAAGRPPRAVLLPRPDGARWKTGDQQHRFARAAKLAKLPEGSCFYSLRDSYISRAIESGMPLTVIAENCGTSVRQIEKHYAHVLAEKRRELIERHAPQLRRVK